MPAYSISLKPSVEKDMQGLSSGMISRVMQRVESLASNPFPPGVIKLATTERLYRVRVGNYRVVYEVNAATTHIIVHYIRHRREVYRGM